MIIKKFQAKTKEDAMMMAKKELGEGIVEMNVRNVKASGLKRFLIGNRVEVTVALEEENERFGVTPQQSINIAVAEQGTTATLAKPQTASQPEAELNVKNSFASVMLDKSDTSLTQLLQEKKTELFEKKEPAEEIQKGKILEEKLDTLQNLLEQQLQKKEEKEKEEEKTEEVEDNSNSKRVVFLKLLYNKMIDNEVDEKYANEIIEEIEKNNKADASLDCLLADVYQRMILKFGKPSCIEPAENGTKVIFFIGPTGVGKTTTIAKIASQLRVEQHKKVALLTSDTYRIAAAEQLRTYANILEVPFRVVYTPQEVEYAVRDYKDYDYILVDTTGHSQNNEAQRENMSDFLNALPNIEEKEVYLVVSASTKYRDLKNIVDVYREITDYKLIFTKLDETLTLGTLFNLKLYADAPLSYVTCGQNVPDDIEVFNPQKTVKCLLGGKH